MTRYMDYETFGKCKFCFKEKGKILKTNLPNRINKIICVNYKCKKFRK